MGKIAVITGASSGIGKQFAETIQTYGTFDEVWVIARRVDRLNELKLAYPVRAIGLDLSQSDSYEEYARLLRTENPDVGLLVNCSGYGKFESSLDTPLEDNLNMVDLDCKAVMAMCQTTIPFMSAGGQIINIASVAALQPIPYINVYAACKSFVLYYSRALNREVRGRGLHVMAVCPFWTRTEFFSRAVNRDRDAVVKKYVAMYEPEQIVSRAWRDAKRGRDVSKFGFKARGQAMLVKILPHSLVMNIWMNQQKLK